MREYPQWFIDELVKEEDKERALNGTLTSNDKVELMCSLHGKYLQTVKVHIQISTMTPKSGCRLCRYEKMQKAACSEEARKKKSESLRKSKISKRIYSEEFIKTIYKEEDKIRAREGELSVNDKIQFICSTHGPYLANVCDHYRISDQALLWHGCPKCVNGTYRSSYEDVVERIIGLKAEHNVRGEISINGKWAELDLFYRDRKIAIEVNGSYWHSTVGGRTSKEKDYHLQKFIQCQEKGIHLIQIYDVDLVSNRTRIENYLHNIFYTKQKVYARKTEVSVISAREARDFCNRNHIQGASTMDSIFIAIKYSNEIISVMTFGKPRFRDNKDTYELHRYCVKTGVTVIGGASRLFKKFVDLYQPKEIISYSDNDYFMGEIYPTLGFKFEGYTNPRYYWYKGDNNWYKREQCMLKYLRTRYPKTYEESLDYDGNKEDFIMLRQGYCKVYRAGNKKWIWRLGNGNI